VNKKAIIKAAASSLPVTLPKPKKGPAKKPEAPVVVNPLDALKSKFTQLKAIREQIASMKGLYQKHDALMEELMPLFIKIESDKFIVAREISLGTDKFKLSPYFYDEKKGLLVAKVWKSASFASVSIE
jgi:hypothetical protein